jgi:hypothetical protein
MKRVMSAESGEWRVEKRMAGIEKAREVFRG